jgi:beta-N-acetylhexosaminidase
MILDKKSPLLSFVALSLILPALLCGCDSYVAAYAPPVTAYMEETLPQTETAAETEPPLTTVKGVVRAMTAETASVFTDNGKIELTLSDPAVTAPGYGPMYGAEATLRYDNEGKLVSAAIAGVEYGDKAYALLKAMTAEEKAGQLIMASPGLSSVPEALKSCPMGGIVTFASDFKYGTKDSVRALIDSAQAASKIPLIISADEEGGTVCRVSYYKAYRSDYFRSPRTVLANGGLDGAKADAKEKAELLLSLGVNVNLAPVCDISADKNDFIYDRSPGGDAETVSGYVSAVVETSRGAGLGSVLKHFPGYGSAKDTHFGIAYDDRPIERFRESDFLPFAAGIKSGAGAVMYTHIIINSIDPDYPATLSKEAHRLLREELGFDGLAMTDDMNMGAITKFTDGRSAAVAAILAGNDMLAISGDYMTAYNALVEAAKNGTIPQYRLDGAVMRVLIYKFRCGIID